MKIARNLFRILVGLVFIFSGFVKGVDPLGTVFRMNDYFIAFGLPWAQSLSVVLTMILVALEFIIGISLLFNLWIKGTAWILLPLMTFFTILTLFDALYNLVPDCGCFGDAVKLTNVQTFLKNLVLMAFVLPIFIWRKKYRPAIPLAAQSVVLALFLAAFSGMSVYATRHLPLIDFMGWKEGKRINALAKEPVRFYVTYKNRSTGEQKEFLAPNYPWNDSVWMSQWVFVSQRSATPVSENPMTLHIEDEAGNDLTSDILNIPDYHFIVTSYDLGKADTTCIRKLNDLALKASEDGYSFIGLTNAVPDEVHLYAFQHHLQFTYMGADDVILKTMNRSNPGLILIRDGVVIKKWAWRDLPDYGDLKEKYLK